MCDGYEYDLSLSYPRKSHIQKWVKNHFHLLLGECLLNVMAQEPRIFVDWEMESGVNWPETLKRSLLRSRYLVSIWTPPYFRSGWCMAEWGTMLARQALLGMWTMANPRGLVYPVVFSDGDHFPEEAKQTQYRADLSRWNYPDPQFSDSMPYLEFRREMQRVADELAAWLPHAPPWAPDWPVEHPKPAVAGPASLPGP